MLFAVVLLAAPAAWSGPFAFVANRGSDTVTGVDVFGARVVATFATAALPTDVTTSPDGGRLYVATDRHVTEIDLRTDVRRDWPYLPGLNDGNGIAMHPSGDRLFVSHGGAGFVTRMELPAGTVSTIPLPGFDLRHIAMSRDGRWLFGVTSLGHVYQIDAVSGATATLFTAAFPLPTGLATNELGDVIVASDGNLAVERFAVTAMGQAGARHVVASGFRPGGVAADPIGRGAAVTQPFDGRVHYSFGGASPSLGAFAGPFDVAAHRDSIFDVTANLGDVTGRAPAGAGSLTLLSRAGARASLPAGVTPVAVTIAAERGEEIRTEPAAPRFAYAGAGTPVHRDVAIVSVGDREPVIWSVDVAGPDAAAFRIVRDDCRFRSLGYRARCTVRVEFTPFPKPAPWYARYLRVWVPSYAADLVVEFGGREGPLRVPLRAGAYLDAGETVSPAVTGPTLVRRPLAGG